MITSLLSWLFSFWSSDYHRGQRVLTFPQAERAVRKLRSRRGPTFSFGGLQLLLEELLYGLFALGVAGTGKSLTLRMVLQTILPSIGPGTDSRAIVFDQKGDLLQVIAGLPLGCAVETLHPFDKRGVAWDIAADTTSPAHATETVFVLLPESAHESQPFFSEASRHICGALIQSWILSGTVWFLRDLILATRSVAVLTEILTRHSVTAPIAQQYLVHDPVLALNILATLATKLARFEPIAAGWSLASRRLSLRTWLQEESILVLGSDPSARTPLAAINAVFLNRLSELQLSLPDSRTRRTYYVLDELSELGKLALLIPLLTIGRAKGACVMITAQTLALIRRLYGDDDCRAVLSQLQTRSIFRVGTPEDADWASRLVGDVQRWQSNRPTGGKPVKSLVTERAFLPSEFLTLPPTTPENGMTAVWMPRILSGVYRHSLAWAPLMDSLVPPADHVPAIDRRADADLFLRPWVDADRQRLGLSNNHPSHVDLPGRIKHP